MILGEVPTPRPPPCRQGGGSQTPLVVGGGGYLYPYSYYYTCRQGGGSQTPLVVGGVGTPANTCSATSASQTVKTDHTVARPDDLLCLQVW
ncbi:MAG TPA: hypothetical protein PLK82_03060 [Bacteroidales bacterium]|nr:hypothetical protein [Bacteroidales bacterium]